MGNPMMAYGPVPSRRLGRSIGINNIPAKTCTYSCVYCQLGKTTRMTPVRMAFYAPEEIFLETKKQVQKIRGKEEEIDYLTFVPDGEPTLDLNLHREVELLRQLDLPIAMLTNASLIWEKNVRNTLCEFDLVSLKIDAVSENMWRRIDRPHRSLSPEEILDGIVEFSEDYEGTIITETMFIDGVDYSDEISRIAEFLAGIRIKSAYISIPTRPPAENWVRPASESILNHAYWSFSERLGNERVELLIGYEGDTFASTGNLEVDLLSITSVHPMRKDAVKKLVEEAGAKWDSVEKLLQANKLIELEYESEVYYMRKLPSRG
jgi:wyosine [tRNA(Phe)-imidazoG37] synthetase (radical SAM superfamily)